MTKAQQAKKEQALATLREMLKPGDTLYTIQQHVSRSGMHRLISTRVMTAEGPVDVDHLIGALGLFTRDNRTGALRVGGCGMDMGFHVVHNVSHMLYPEGFGCIGQGDESRPSTRCPSNDHSNGDRDYTPHASRLDATGQGHWHRSGDYALRHRWL
jgi:hypothetical protein